MDRIDVRRPNTSLSWSPAYDKLALGSDDVSPVYGVYGLFKEMFHSQRKLRYKRGTFLMLSTELLPGPSTPICYNRKYVITEYVITGLYCMFKGWNQE